MENKIEKEIAEQVPEAEIKVSVENDVAYLKGRAKTWDDYVEAGHIAGERDGIKGVVADVKVDETSEKEDEKKESGPEKVIKENQDVIIVGGGVSGCFIARELSKYDLDVTIVEKELDVSMGASKANNGCIHVGIDQSRGTLKHELCLKGNAMYDDVAEELDVPFERVGTLLVMTDRTFPEKISSAMPDFLEKFLLKHIVPRLVTLYGKIKSVPGLESLSPEEVKKREPEIREEVYGGVLMPTMGIIPPYELVIALAENAVENGVDLMLDTEVLEILVDESNKVQGVQTDKGIIKGDYVINAAGVYADELAETAGAREFTIHPRKGSLMIFDKKESGLTNHVVSELRFGGDEYTKGGTAMPTPDGNPEWGPTAIEVPEKEDVSVSSEEIEMILDKYGYLFPDFETDNMIRYFAGVRATTFTEDFFIESSDKAPGLVNVAGIQSPGLASSPAIAEYVLNILEEEGLEMEEDPDFKPTREEQPKFNKLSEKERKKLIEKDPKYGQISCRCEKVTEREVINAIQEPVPALTIDAVKRRTRAGMGRCQGGFCRPRITKILSRELNIPLEKVQKKKGGNALGKRTKEEKK